MFIINIKYINIIIINFILRNTFFNAFYQEKIQKFKLTFNFFFIFLYLYLIFFSVNKFSEIKIIWIVLVNNKHSACSAGLG